MTSTETDAPRGRMRGLVAANALGSFNDNAWKILVALLALRALKASGVAGPALETAAQRQASLAFIIFTVPLVLASLPAGVLADRLAKRRVIVAAKGLELALMAAGTVALALHPTDVVLPLVVLGLMGLQAALYGPAKYGILPEILPHERLTAGNALLESWSFLAIIAGSALGGLMLDRAGPRPWLAGLALTATALVGFVAARTIPAGAPARATGGLVETLTGARDALRADRVLKLAVFGSIYFWTIAALLSQDVLVYAKTVIGVTDSGAGLPLAAFGIGVGAGSILAARLSASQVEYGLIPLGAVGFAVTLTVLGALAPGLVGTLVLMAILGVASGFLIVPLNALVQWRAPAERRGAVIALSNALVFSGILMGSVIAGAMAGAGFSSRDVMIGAAVLTAAGTIWALRLLPDALLRLVLVILTHTFYRVTVVGRPNVPRTGGALLVPNHVSFADGLFLIAALDRRVRFIVEAEYFEHPILRPFMRSIDAIPIASTGGPRVILRALRDAGKKLDEGHLVCVFAEGQLTRTGLMQPFRRGMERIVQGRSVPIVPVNLDRVWGSIFSRAGGRFLTRLPERIPYPITVSFGAPLPASTPLHEVRRAVHDLGEQAWGARRRDRRPLHAQVVSAARRRPLAFAMADATRPRLSRLGVVSGAVALARALREPWRGQERVGILLPPGIGGALANLAAALAGRTSVNINYTAGPAGMRSACEQAGLGTVLTSRLFLEKAKLALPDGVTPIWIEDVRERIGFASRCAAGALALGAPVRVVERLCGARRPVTLDDVATIIFSSGSTGDPKGVPLTHYNLDANLQGVRQVFHLGRHDRVLGILPLFHSFGTLILWLALGSRVGIVFHPNPLDAAAIGALVQRYRVTFLVATPTFLGLYMRRCTPAQFGSLNLILTGAEKLPERVAQSFEDIFGIRPLEGYGATECSPVIAVSTLDFRAPGFYQPGSRRGSAGQALPGVALRVVDPDTWAPREPNESGLLLVRGPNVMSGYLGRDDLTAEALRDGWYVTGDIAALDEDGFLRITDRLSRFSKIGGEMVPHGKVEEALNEAAGAGGGAGPARPPGGPAGAPGAGGPVLAVTAVPDARKGERLAVLHTLDPAAIPAILEKVAQSGLPNLFIPRADQFVKVETIPLLGTGKLDLRAMRRIAAEALGAAGVSAPG
jgi:acyl-[acyl-carrier-protein]-phospholipid O-acyltransferase/long-chain-fatty-acid--[acyl-carrier-protein] ligase